MRAWGNRTGNFNIQVDFAIGTVWCSRRMIVSMINRRTCNLRQRDVQLLEVGLEVLVLVAPTQFDESYTLAASIKGGTGLKVIQLGKL